MKKHSMRGMIPIAIFCTIGTVPTTKYRFEQPIILYEKNKEKNQVSSASQTIQKAYTVQHRTNVIVSFLRVCDGDSFAYIANLVNFEGSLDSNPQKP
jgi:hypothetical protein